MMRTLALLFGPALAAGVGFALLAWALFPTDWPLVRQRQSVVLAMGGTIGGCVFLCCAAVMIWGAL